MARAMKETIRIWSLWKKSVQWDSKTVRQKLIATWFSLSMVGVGVMACGNPLLSAMSVLNLVVATYFCVKYVPMEEE